MNENKIPCDLLSKWKNEATAMYPVTGSNFLFTGLQDGKSEYARYAYITACRKRWEEDNWISVEDALPEEAGRYEVVREYGLGIGRDVCITNYIKCGKVWVTGNNWKVTHWKNIKPLPSQPLTAPATDTGDK